MKTVLQALGGIVEHVIPNRFEHGYGPNEALFREQVIQSAFRYLGTPYRWGGKTPAGIDCSGLCSMAYMLNGAYIYRDAKIMDGFPLKEITREELKRGAAWRRKGSRPSRSRGANRIPRPSDCGPWPGIMAPDSTEWETPWANTGPTVTRSSSPARGAPGQFSPARSPQGIWLFEKTPSHLALLGTAVP